MLLVPFTFLFAPSKYNPNHFINFISNKDPHYNTIRYLRSLYIITYTALWVIIVVRNFKIYIVLKTKIEDKIVQFFFKYEIVAFLIGIFVPLYAIH